MDPVPLFGQGKLPTKPPRKKGSKEEEYTGFCAVDSRLSGYILDSPYMRPRAVRTLATRKRGSQKIRGLPDDLKNAWDPNVRVKVRVRNKVIDKRPICRFHRETNQIGIPGRPKQSYGPTTMESKLICPEQYLWNHDPRLKTVLKTPTTLFLGAVVHKVAADYAKTGKAMELGHRGVEGWVNLALTNHQALGLTYPLQDPSRGNLEMVRKKALRIVWNGIRAGEIQTLADIAEDPAFILAEVEFPVSFQVSTVVRELMSNRDPGHYDFIVSGRLDRIIIRALPGPKLEITIRDWKSRDGQLPNLSELEQGQQSLQMQLYGAWALWAARPLYEVMPPVEVKIEHAYLSEEGVVIRKAPFNRESVRQSFDNIESFVKSEEEAKQFLRESPSRWQERAKTFYPPQPGSYCRHCPAFGLCTETRPEDRRRGYLDQILPAKTEPKGTNMPLWDTS